MDHATLITRIVTVVAVAGVVPATGACGERPPREAAARANAAPADRETAAHQATPDTTGAAVWSHLQASDYRNEWPTWPGKGELYRGQEPHGMLLTTYLNPVAHDAVTNRAGVFPAGAIIVKENYTPDSTLAAVTTMMKVEGYNPSAGDWFWVKQDANGVVDMEGKAQGRVPMCIGCHSQRAANDYVFTGPVE